MLIFRLLRLSLLIALGAATVAAQSSPEKIPAPIQSLDSGRLNSSANPDILSPNSKAGLNPPNALDRILTGDYSPHLNQVGVPHSFLHMEPDWQPQNDKVCLKMRTYKVARDAPHSDSTHPVGYSTCQPAVRFQTRSIVLRVPSPTP